MKHLIFVLLALFGLSAFAGNFGDHVQVNDLQKLASISATGAGATSFDTQGYVGPIVVLLASHNTAGTLPTMAIKIQDSADNSSFADVSGATFSSLTTADSSQKLVVNRDGSLRRYIQVVFTIGGTSSPAYSMYVTALATKKYPQ